MKGIGFVFSGQGAQTPGMMKELYDNYEAVRSVFHTADRILGRSIRDLCFNGSQDDLNLTHNTQPCMLAADLAAVAAVMEFGIMPDAVAGFSLGEYAALVAAGVLSIEDAFRIIQIRADAMQKAVPVGRGAMAAIMKVSSSEVEELCKAVEGYVIPANYNSPVQTVVSGEAEAVDKLLELAKGRKIRAVRLPVSAPFHCKLMEPAMVVLRDMFTGIAFQNALIPLYMNVDGKKHVDSKEIVYNVLQQTISPVRWIDTITSMYNEGINTFIELGAGHTLTGLNSKIVPEASVASIADLHTLKSVITTL